jgi:hypothetical protein
MRQAYKSTLKELTLDLLTPILQPKIWEKLLMQCPQYKARIPVSTSGRAGGVELGVKSFVTAGQLKM